MQEVPMLVLEFLFSKWVRRVCSYFQGKPITRSLINKITVRGVWVW